jgi:hypothetical protein
MRIPRLQKILLLCMLPCALLLAGFRYLPEWSKYTSAAGHYTVSFPGKPSETTQMDTSDPHKPVAIHYTTYFPSDSEGYMADWIDMHQDYPAGRSIKYILEHSRDGALKSVGATKATTTATNLGKDPYIEFTFTNKEYTGKGRIYIINKFQYAIISLYSPNGGAAANADTFIRSFRHLP